MYLLRFAPALSLSACFVWNQLRYEAQLSLHQRCSHFYLLVPCLALKSLGKFVLLQCILGFELDRCQRQGPKLPFWTQVLIKKFSFAFLAQSISCGHCRIRKPSSPALRVHIHNPAIQDCLNQVLTHSKKIKQLHSFCNFRISQEPQHISVLFYRTSVTLEIR